MVDEVAEKAIDVDGAVYPVNRAEITNGWLEGQRDPDRSGSTRIGRVEKEKRWKILDNVLPKFNNSVMLFPIKKDRS